MDSFIASSGNDPFHHVTFMHQRTTLERLDKFLSNHHFTDVNLFGRLYKERRDVSLRYFGPTSRHAFADLRDEDFVPVPNNHSFGPTFSTHWFKIEIEFPTSWDGEEIVLLWQSDRSNTGNHNVYDFHLGSTLAIYDMMKMCCVADSAFSPEKEKAQALMPKIHMPFGAVTKYGCEGMVWRDGHPVFGVTSENVNGITKFYRITEELKQNHPHKVTLFMEVACNRLLGEGRDGLINPPKMDKMFSVSQAQVATMDKCAWDVFYDLQILHDIATHHKTNGTRALDVANDAINELVCAKFEKGSPQRGYNRAKKILQSRFSGMKQDDDVVHALGHCHIDSAWLWPYAETIRKCARSWVSVVSLMDRFPDFKFACSQAQQFTWVKEYYPSVYQRIKEKVKSGKFQPVGGTWVEMDGNIPSGEAMVRQFFYGQRFFREEFGKTCHEFWLPDTFGYSANLPQIMREADISNFVTQKLSWNLVNKFPHTTFFWRGIDGSRVLSHFPPANDYGARATANDVMRSANNLKEKGRLNDSLLLFGFGDGGGGPTEDMLERLTRMQKCNDLPKVEMTSTDELFARIRQQEDKLHTWNGELFLELHNGTYTTQAKIKKMNRKCEVLLRDVELAATMMWMREGTKYPHEEIDELWKIVLLNQFHDVLPGSSIEMVNDDAHEYYDKVMTEGRQLLERYFPRSVAVNDGVVFNTLPWPRTLVMDQGTPKMISVLGINVSKPTLVGEYKHVKVDAQDDEFIKLSNEHLSCMVDHAGRITSLRLVDNEVEGREIVMSSCLANQMVLFDDVPLFWDAWDVMDYHLETRHPVVDVLEKLTIDESSCYLRAVLTFKLRLGEKSTMRQKIVLESKAKFIKFETEVEWNEDHKFLKVEFPWQLLSPRATYEIQFGHVGRPTNQNTSWDTARFEVWGHKWADYSEYDMGVAILNDCKYGYSTFGSTMRLSLLRSPKAPDANADMGKHTFTYAVMPHRGSFQQSNVIRAAYELNNPLHWTQSNRSFPTLLTTDNDAIILDTIKKSHCHEEAIVMRFYESFGGTVTRSKVTFPNDLLFRVQRCNILEDIYVDEIIQVEQHSFILDLNPFQFKTFLIWFN